MMNAVVLTAGAAIIDDAFDDGDWTTNTNGDGSGWDKADAGVITEASGEVRLEETSASARTVGLLSKDTFDVTAGLTVATFDAVRYGFGLQANNYTWVLGNDITTVNGLANGMAVELDPSDNSLRVVAKQAAGGSEYTLLSGATVGNGFDLGNSFIVELTVDPTALSGNGNWNVDITSGNGSTVFYSSGNKNFNAGGGENISTYFTADVSAGFGMRTSADGAPVIRMDQVTVIPEPAALGLIAMAGAGILFIRRLRM
jgi:hypothetical protein